MTDKTKLMMTYLYRRERKEKGVTLREILDWTRSGKYAQRVEAVRGHAAASTGYGLASGALAAAELPRILPARSDKGAYTGLVLLSLRIDDGLERIEQLRRMVNVWEQTLLSFVGSSGRSLKVLIPYCLPGGGLPEEPQQVALFQQYAYKRASEYVFQSTGIRPEEILHDGSEGFRISYDPQAWLNLGAKAIEMSQPTEPLSDTTAEILGRDSEPALDTEVLPGYTRREMDITNYNAICRQLAFDRYRQPDEHLLLLAAECRKAGIDQELAIKLTINQHLRRGEKVRIDRLGLLKLEILSDKVDAPEEFDPQEHIKGVRLHILPESRKGSPALYKGIRFEATKER